jgi:CRISPR-associated exonuclease Cas4
MLISVIFFLISKKIKRDVKKTKTKNRIQEGKIAYSDLSIPANPFFSKKYRITGKPDYVVKQNKYFIPVELKTGTHNKPLKNHVYQIAAYCQLLEENYRGFVPYGILVYNNKDQFKIPFDPKTRFELESTIKKMRYTIKTGKITINHSDFRRCKACSMRKYCNNKIS